MRAVKYLMCVLMTALLLTGCAKRELEDRSFPSVLAITTAEVEKEQNLKQEESSQYIDYGHVKAVILSEEIAGNGESLKEVLLYLEDRPVFARSILIFAGDEQVLKAAETDSEQMGAYLEKLYKNQPKGSSFKGTALKEMLNYLHNLEESIDIPYLIWSDGKALPQDSLTIRQSVAPTMNSPVPRRINE